MDIQVSGLAEHQASADDVGQTEAMTQSSISIIREMTAVSSSMKEYPTKEESTFVLK